jgi:hypothetical protein
VPHSLSRGKGYREGSDRGIGELVGAHQRARRDGRRIVVVRNEGTRIQHVLRVAELDVTLETELTRRGGGGDALG